MKNQKLALNKFVWCAAVLASFLGGGGYAATVDNVTDLTNQIHTAASGSTIYLAKGRYDISGCRGELMGGSDAGLLAIPNGRALTLAGAPGTARGDVIVTAPDATSRMLYLNKGTLVCSNLTFTGASGGAIRVGNADGKLFLYDCVFSNLTATSGAAVSRYYATAAARGENDFYGCLFADCHATSEKSGAHDFRGGNAYDCVYSNCTSTASGGAVTGGNYVRCSFYACKTSTTGTAQGGGAIGSDYEANVGFCTDCTFVACETTGTAGAHGAAVYQTTALTNCTFRDNVAHVNEIVFLPGEIVGCTFEDNDSEGVLFGGAGLVLNTRIVANRTGAKLSQNTPGIVANTLVASNTCTKAQGIFTSGQFVNCSFIGNFCTSGRVNDSILGAACVAVNCLFYQNRAHNLTYNDMAMRFVEPALTTPLSPYLTNSVWTAETTYNDAHTTAAYARTEGCQLQANLRLTFSGAADEPFYTLGASAFARHGGLVTDEIRAIVGTTDLAGRRRFTGETISLGCYEHQERGLLWILR